MRWSSNALGDENVRWQEPQCEVLFPAQRLGHRPQALGNGGASVSRMDRVRVAVMVDAFQVRVEPGLR
jgi:hypothetical protein